MSFTSTGYIICNWAVEPLACLVLGATCIECLLELNERDYDTPIIPPSSSPSIQKEKNVNKSGKWSLNLRQTVRHNECEMYWKKMEASEEDSADDSQKETNEDQIGNNHSTTYLLELDRVIQQLKELTNKIRQLIEDDVNVTDEERISLFRELISILELLIHNHGASFNHSQFPRIKFGITLTDGCGEKVAFFDRQLQEFFNVIRKMIRNKNLPLEFSGFRCFIFCIHCRVCFRQFRYVGQVVNSMRMRGGRQMTVIDSWKSGLLSQHLEQEHPEFSHADLYEIDLLHDLPDNDALPGSKNGPRDERIRRTWEIFYQWAFKAMDFDGGACIR